MVAWRNTWFHAGPLVSSTQSLRDDVAMRSPGCVSVHELCGPTGLPNHIENQVALDVVVAAVAIVVIL